MLRDMEPIVGQGNLKRIVHLQPLKSRCFFACEGTKTEPNYFRALRIQSRELGLNGNIEIEIIDKEINYTRPDLVFKWAMDKLEEKIQENEFNVDLDSMVIVFDADVIDSRHTLHELEQLVEERNQQIQKEANRRATLGRCVHLMVTNPSFELFLLLHKEAKQTEGECVAEGEPNEQAMGALELIERHRGEILDNGMHPVCTGQRYVCGLFSIVFHKNPKSNASFRRFVLKVKIAIENEKSHLINQDVCCTVGNLTSNVGRLIEDLLFVGSRGEGGSACSAHAPASTSR